MVKPLWENLRKNLSSYLLEAEHKLNQKNIKKPIWITDINKRKELINLQDLICVCQETENPYNKNYFITNHQTLTIKISWQEIIEQLKGNNIDFFVTNGRHHLIVKKQIASYKRPFIKLINFPHKIEVVKEKLHDFEKWLEIIE